MKAFIITLRNNVTSEKAAMRCVDSSKKHHNTFQIQLFEATNASNALETLDVLNLKWSYPEEGHSILHAPTGLKLTGYRSAHPLNRIACSLSHYRIWNICSTSNEPILVLEHDAIFIRDLNLVDIYNRSSALGYSILGLNNPLGATRKAQQFHDNILKSNLEFQDVPWIDHESVPQGLAGNSAYLITPDGANQCIDLMRKYGVWPNDAIMCKQLVKGLGVTRNFYTQVQGTRSTTTL